MGFQSWSSEQGRMFHDQCVAILERAGFTVRTDRDAVTFPELGIELDAIADNRFGISFLCEFKGSWSGHRPGLLRTDTVKKALHSAYSLYAEGNGFPFLILASHTPDGDGKSCAAMIEAASRHGVVADVICVNNPADAKRLHSYADVTCQSDWDRCSRREP